MKLYSESVKARYHLYKLRSDIVFIQACKRETLVPTFARVHLANPHLHGSKVREDCARSILQAELKFKKRLLTRTHRHSKRLQQQLRESVSELVFCRLHSITEEIVSKRMKKVQRRHDSKLNGLLKSKVSSLLGYSSKKRLNPVTNLSNRVLTVDEHRALIQGLHHVYPNERFDQAKFVCNIEFFYARLLNFRTEYRDYERKEAKTEVVHQLSSVQLNAASRFRSTANSVQRTAQIELKELGQQHRTDNQVLRSLANDQSIVITRPDKGRGVVIMNKSEYIQKMQTILNDDTTFHIIDHDPTIANENRLIRTLLRLKKEGFITEGEYHLARPTGSRAARLYGLPKLHKPNCPLRPVMSATKTVGYGLGKMLTSRLSQLRTSPYTIKDSFDFVNKIRTSANVDKTMVSFDVTSLFTNVPLTYTITYILDRMYPVCQVNCQHLPTTRKCTACRARKDFESLLRTATSETHFTFDNKMYVQHNGVAMGAPLAPVMADIFMAHLETTLMDELASIGVCEWHRYVDDTFVLVQPGTNVADILSILNGFHPSIKFTYETETKSSLPFLDVQVTRSPGRHTFETTIYRKPTFTGLMINWNSFVPLQYKKASIDSMVRRALSICSTYDLMDVEFQQIRRYGLANGYPRSFINTHIGVGLNRYMEKQVPQIIERPIGCEKKRMYVEIPFIGRTTQTMKQQFNHLSSQLRPDLDIRFFTKPPPSVQTFFRNKDPVAKHMQSSIVYSVQCNDCDQLYIGKTIRHAMTRLCEHGAPASTFDASVPATTASNVPTLRRSSRVLKKTTTTMTTTDRNRRPDNEDQSTSSALTSHAQETGHHINWSDFKVVWQDNNPYRLLIKESLLIQAFQPELNRTTHSIPMIVFPDGLPRQMLPDPNG